MNFLAHAYLSMKKSGVITGNLISDYVKGKKQYDYPERVRAGIILHRSIDEFTDKHESTRTIKSFFAPHYRLYAGAFCDVVYDHFLANDRMIFPDARLIDELTAQVYADLEEHADLLPPAFVPVYQSMREHNWLGLYGNDWAVKRSFDSLAKRSRYLTEAEIAYGIFLQNKNLMQGAYEAYFPALQSFSIMKLEQLLPE